MKRVKRNLLVVMVMGLALSGSAQVTGTTTFLNEMEVEPSTNFFERNNVFRHLEGSVTLGTTGVGVELASPIGNYVNLRAGFSIMPHFDYPMHFDVQVGESAEESVSKFQRLSEMFEEFTGNEIDDRVTMIGTPSFYNFNAQLDFFPFPNKRWFLSAGVYIGPSTVAKAVNATEDMSTLFCVTMYNTAYPKILNREPVFTYRNIGYPGDPELQDALHDSFESYGRMGVRVGDFKSDGSPYMMEPDESSMVKATMKANSVKPYLGFGYGGSLSKRSDRFGIFFNCGALFWGGTPQVFTHDGTNLSKDVTNVRGQVGDYLEVIDVFKVFPVLNLRLSCRLF